MIKIIPLVQACLKEFMRNKSSIFLLIIFPLLLISVIFLSFNTEGMQIIPVGVIYPEDFPAEEFNSGFSSFMKMTEFNNLDECLNEVKEYKQYLCVVITLKENIVLDIYFDNTREYIIWEVLGRIKDSVDYIQKEKSKQIASDFLSKFDRNMNKLSNFKSALNNVNSNIDVYIYRVDDSIQDLQGAKSELQTTIYQMDRDISEAKSTRYSLESDKNSLYNNIDYRLNYAENNLNSINNITGTNYYYVSSAQNQIDSARDTLDNYDDQADDKFDQFDERIGNYEEASENGKNRITDINNAINELRQTKSDLYDYKNRILRTEDELETVETEFQDIQGLSPDLLVNPVIVQNNQIYIPEVSEKYFNQNKNEEDQNTEESNLKSIIKGVNLISLQTLFPTVLFLITLFVSLLVSTFICLREINSTANKRMKLIKGIFLPSFVSVYLSSLIIMIIPIISILSLGHFLFQLPIFDHGLFIFISMFLISSIFIFIGMGLAYLIKKESITLLVASFILVFLLFFSGFLLPVERMSYFAALFANNFAGNIMLEAFNKVIFHSRELWVVYSDFNHMFIWFVILGGIALLIKKLKNN